MAISAYSTTAGSNTAISGINIAEGCPPSGINDAIRQLMADIASQGLARFQTRAADLPSAATLNLDGSVGEYVNVTGTTGITAITLADGKWYATKFAAALTITNGASLICPGGVNYTTAAGDVLIWVGEASGVVRCIGGLKANGTALGQVFSKGADVASASTIDISGLSYDFAQLTGTTTITAMTMTSGDEKTLYYVGAGLNITLGASLTLNGLASGTLVLQTGDVLVVRRDGTVSRIITVMRANGRPGSITGVEATIASAATTDLGTLSSKLVSITGTTTITSFGFAQLLDPIYFIQFTGALTLTHNATSLILPGAANITTAAGDCAIMKYEGSGNWRALNYVKATGLPIVSQTSQFTLTFTSTDQTITSAGLLTLAHSLGTAPKFVNLELVCQTGEFGYTAGDVVRFGPYNDSNLACKYDATNVYIRFGANANALGGANYTTGASANFTNGNWKLRVKAWA